MDLNVDRDMKIDESALDVEWLEQAALGLRYGRHCARLNQEVRRLEEKKKTIRSELIVKANESPKQYLSKDKPNAADIEAFYRTQDEYKQTVEELNEAMYAAEMAGVAKNEICFTRKSALENLVKLNGQNYFAGPAVPRDLSVERERVVREQNETTNIKVAQAMKRRK